MTISEALEASKETGRSYARSGAFGPIGYGGWIAYHETHLYHDLTATDLMADDWVTSAEMMELLSAITGGWKPALTKPEAAGKVWK